MRIAEAMAGTSVPDRVSYRYSEKAKQNAPASDRVRRRAGEPILEENSMSKEPTLKDQTKKAFKDTVDIYSNDLNSLFKNPWPLVIVAVVVLLLFGLAFW
jgi:hypothetical protein